jgi:hypothetical protein
MTKFQLGLLIGFFLGALSLFVVLGIIQLYLEERRPRNSSAAATSSGGGCRLIPQIFGKSSSSKKAGPD